MGEHADRAAALPGRAADRGLPVRRLDVELLEPGAPATDGEIVEEAGRYTFRVSAQPVPVHRRSSGEPR